MPSTRIAYEDEPLALEIERTFDAPPALVFRMWSDPEHLVRWHGPEGMFLTRCEQDFRVGGAWRRCMSNAEGYEHWIRGVFREIEPPRRLSFTYINEADGFETLVSMDFAPAPGGRTLMLFRQSPFLNKGERDGHGWGWNSSFELLAGYVGLFRGIEGAPLGKPRRDGVAEDLIAARQRHETERKEGEIADADRAAHR